jgi:hypothetical protein
MNPETARSPYDAQLWRIDWIGGVAHNASVPSEPVIDVCLARLPKGETNPLGVRLRSSETKICREHRRWPQEVTGLLLSRK